MKPLHLIIPEEPSKILTDMINATVGSYPTIVIKSTEDMPDLRDKKIIFGIEVGDTGYCINLYNILSKLWDKGKDSMAGSTGAVLIHSNSELYTKSVAREIIFRTNQMGCRFPGRPMVEATGSLSNLLTLQKVVKKPLDEVCMEVCKTLGETFIKDDPKPINSPKLLVLHASNRNTSNTLRLWDMVKSNLDNIKVKEIHIENGTVRDCIGCPYKTCKHYGKQTSCFYGGIMVEEIYPAVLESDAIVWICPNYNDAITANLSAVINRLTALFRQTKFYDKSIFSIVVSGNSGGDILSKQLIGALNVNKTFRLPPYFSIMATANDLGAILKVPDIEQMAKEFAANISKEIKA